MRVNYLQALNALEVGRVAGDKIQLMHNCGSRNDGIGQFEPMILTNKNSRRDQVSVHRMNDGKSDELFQQRIFRRADRLCSKQLNIGNDGYFWLCAQQEALTGGRQLSVAEVNNGVRINQISLGHSLRISEVC